MHTDGNPVIKTVVLNSHGIPDPDDLDPDDADDRKQHHDDQSGEF